MIKPAYYNEHDKFAAQWLRNLITAGHIAPGDVDERSIEDVRPDDLRPYRQCHFFAGIGIWSVALRRAGWPDDKPVWTGSCPCQPFSAAGQGAGFADERHLWPAFFHLITQRRPATVFGEQVASADGLAWLDLVQADLEGASYASAAVDLCAAGVGAPHIRQRLFWVADAANSGWSGIGGSGQEGIAERGDVSGMADANEQQRYGSGDERQAGRRESADDGAIVRMADSDRGGREEGREIRSVCQEYDAEYGGAVGGLGDSQELPFRAFDWKRNTSDEFQKSIGGSNISGERTDPTNGYWRAADWLACRDGKWRPVEPGTFPLAHGAAARVGRLRAYGNAISPQVAEAFIRATGLI